METEIIWLAPLLVLPGVGLLIVSTSSRYSTLHDEIHHWLDDNHDVDMIEQAHLVTRARHFRNALVSLYASVFFFVFASLVGAVFDFADIAADVAVFAIATLGIVAVSFAAFELIRESLLSLDVIKSHIAHMMSNAQTDPES